MPQRGRAAPPSAPGVSRADAAFFRAFDLLAVWVVSVSWAAIGLLAADAFDAATAVVAGALMAAAAVWAWAASAASAARGRLDGGRPRSARSVLPVLLVVLLAALLFRMHPFRTLEGGQDQGVYAAMSAHLQREGSVFFDDPLPDALPERAREIYRARQPDDPPFGASVQPGVYHSRTRADYVFQFYHLQAMWMAAFADLLGDGARFHALTFFGLLSILGLCLLTRELTGSRRAVLAVGLLLAVNPLHAYFSRLPLTEAFALAFSSVGVCYLLRALRGMRAGAPAAGTGALLALSGASVSLVFFTRITGFLYLPALAPLFALGVWSMDRGRLRGRQLAAYSVAVAALYGLSVLYGLALSPVYARSVYERTFGGLLGESGPAIAAGAALVAAAALAALAAFRRRAPAQALLARAVDARVWTWLATALVGAALAGSLFQAYRVGFGGGDGAGALGVGRDLERFGVVGSGAGIFLQSGAAGWLLYASPLLVVVLVWGMHRRGRAAAAAPLIYFFLSVCLAAHLLLNVPVIYHHYYYARYLLSEVVPWTLVLAVVLTAGAGPGAFRRLGWLAIAMAVPFHLYFTIRQAPVREGVEQQAVLTRIAERVGQGVVLLDADGVGAPRLRTPLDLYYGAHVFPYAAEDLDAIADSFEGALDGGPWLLTATPTVHGAFQLEETFTYRYERMEDAPAIPVDAVGWTRTLYLYRQPGVCDAPGCNMRLEADRLYTMGRRYVYVWRLLGAGWYGPEETHVWSGREAMLNLRREWFASGRWPNALRLQLWPFGAAPDHPVTLTVASGRRTHLLSFFRVESGLHEAPLGCSPARDTCTVRLAVEGARTPRDVYGQPDERTLGISLERVGFRY